MTEEIHGPGYPDLYGYPDGVFRPTYRGSGLVFGVSWQKAKKAAESGMVLPPRKWMQHLRRLRSEASAHLGRELEATDEGLREVLDWLADQYDEDGYPR